MGNSDKENYYATLGLSADASLDQVKKRFKELNEAYLRILELSKGDKNAPAKSVPAHPKPSSPLQETHTKPIATIKERLAKGEINQTQFEKLAKERYEYLKNKPFSELSDEELEERLKGFEGLKIYPKYTK
jgi:hypothetical protein